MSDDLSVIIGSGKKLDSSKCVIVDFDGTKTVNYEEGTSSSASFQWPTYTVTFVVDGTVTSQVVKFGSTAVVPEISLSQRKAGYFAWSPDITGKKIYQDTTSYLVKKTDAIVISIYDNQYTQDVNDIAAIIEKFNSPINNVINNYDISRSDKNQLIGLLTKHEKYNIDDASSSKALKAKLKSYNNDPDSIPSLVIFHISTNQIIVKDDINSETIPAHPDPITGEMIPARSHEVYDTYYFIQSANFTYNLYKMYSQLYGTGYCNRVYSSSSKRYSGKRMFVLSNAPYSFFFVPGYDRQKNLLGYYAWWVCYMPWYSMGNSMTATNTQTDFISRIKQVLCDGKFKNSFPSYCQVCNAVRSMNYTGSTTFPKEYPFFT